MDNNLIYVNRLGGIGNQLFQVANGYSLSKEYNKKMYISDITNQNLKGLTSRDSFNKTMFPKFKRGNIGNLKNFKMCNEKMFNYQKIILDNKSNYILNGYYQTEKYFKKYSEEIKDLFLKQLEKFKSPNNYIFEQNKTISLHVRRTDYVTIQHIHPCCTFDYYTNALNYLDYKDKKIIVFSDDLNWCKNQEFFKNKNVFYEIDNEEYDSEENILKDLYSISKCNENIISNSTFSWWGSYLNKNENKKIIAPKVWFGNKTFDSYRNIYTDEMILF